MMGWFSKTLSPLYLGTPQPLVPARLESIAHTAVGVGTGLKMLSAQAASEW